MQKWSGEAARTNVKGAGLANESLVSARTVFSLGAEQHFIERYVDQALHTDK